MLTSGDQRRPIDAELIEYLVAVVPDEASAEAVLGVARDLDERGTVTLLDNAVIARDLDGAAHFAELPPSPTGRRPARRRVLTEHDLELIADAVRPGSVALVMLLEDRWAGELAAAARAVGGHIAGGERVPPDRAAALIGADLAGGL
jgi:hypothetical protein